MIQPEGAIPLKLYMTGCATQAEMNANVTASLERGYEPFTGHIGSRAGTVHLCGAGPSLRETWRDIPAGADVLAVNSAIGYLVDQGRAPTFGMIWDAAEVCEKFVAPHPDVTYLVGARCHPKVFERLKDQRVICWHAGGDHNIAQFLAERGIEEPLINGGTAGVTRGIFLALALGYKEIHLHGADSCYGGEDGNDTHIRGSLVPEKDIRVFLGGQWFRTTPEWCAQINEIMMMYPMFHDQGIVIKCHGRGMMRHAVELIEQDLDRSRGHAQFLFSEMAALQAQQQNDPQLLGST